MNLEQSMSQFDDSLMKKSVFKTRQNNQRDDLSVISNATSVFGSLQSSTLNKVKEKTDQLYSHFLAVIQSGNNEQEVFDTVHHLRQVLENTIEEMKTGSKKSLGANSWIRHEMNTWSLIHCIYKDRLVTQKDEMETDDIALVNSEKSVVEHLYLSKLMVFNLAHETKTIIINYFH